MKASEQNKPVRGARLALLLLCFLTFVLYAMYYNSFGPNAQAAMRFFAIDEAKNGLILTVQSIGCLVLTVLLGLFGERLHKIRGIALGLGLMGLAGLCISLLPRLGGESAYGLMMLFSVFAGVGFITIDLLMNSVIADVFPQRKEALLPVVHAFYGVGSMLAPIFVTALVTPERPETFALPYRIIGAAAIPACAVLLLVSRRVSPETPYADMSAIRARARQNPAEIFREGRAWLYLLASFLYLIFQTGVTTWLPTFCQQMRQYSFSQAGLTVTAYFLGVLTVRLLSPLIYQKLSVERFHVLSLLLSAGAFLAFLFLPLPPVAGSAVIFVLGLLQGVAVPGIVVLCCGAFPDRTASASSLVVFGVSLAGMVGPALMGHMMEHSGYMSAMLLALGSLLLSVILLPKGRKA